MWKRLCEHLAGSLDLNWGFRETFLEEKVMWTYDLNLAPCRHGGAVLEGMASLREGLWWKYTSLGCLRNGREFSTVALVQCGWVQGQREEGWGILRLKSYHDGTCSNVGASIWSKASGWTLKGFGWWRGSNMIRCASVGVLWVRGGEKRGTWRGREEMEHLETKFTDYGSNLSQDHEL